MSEGGSRKLVVQDGDSPWLSRDVYPHTRHGRIRWKTLICANRTDSRELTMGMVEFPPGQSLQRHRHPECEVYYVIEGTGEMEIDGEYHALCKGTAVFVPGDALHSLRNTGTATLTLVYTFAADSFDEVRYTYDGEPHGAGVDRRD